MQNRSARPENDRQVGHGGAGGGSGGNLVQRGNGPARHRPDPLGHIRTGSHHSQQYILQSLGQQPVSGLMHARGRMAGRDRHSHVATAHRAVVCPWIHAGLNAALVGKPITGTVRETPPTAGGR